MNAGTDTPRRKRPPLELIAVATLCLGLLLALGGPLLLCDSAPRPGVESATSAALTSAGGRRIELASAPERGPRAPLSQSSSPLSQITSPQTTSSQIGSAGAPNDLPLEEKRTASSRAGVTPRLRGRGSLARARREAQEEILGALGGARLRFGLACGTYGAAAHVPLRLELLPEGPRARTLSWELRHDPRLKVEALSAGPAAREAEAALSYEALGPGRLLVHVSGKRPLGTGELCLVRFDVPAVSESAPLPPYSPLEALALRLDEQPRHGASASGALRLEQ